MLRSRWGGLGSGKSVVLIVPTVKFLKFKSFAMVDKYNDILSRLATPSRWSGEDERALLEPFVYITANPGKEIRGKMIEAFNTWLRVPEDKLKVIARVVSMLHSASLMVDDIEDDSQLRRGSPVTHKIYGVPQTINSANYVYFLAYQELARLREPSSVSSGHGTSDVAGSSPEHTAKRVIPDKDLDLVVTAELLALHRGQGLDLLWRDTLRCPTEDEYIDMVNNKTGGLFRIAIKLMMAYATTNINVDYIPLVNLVGVYFQIRDDYMNLQSGQYTANKGFAEDLSEGKFSFPIVHGVRADTANRQILNVLQKRPSSPSLKIHAISYLENHTRSLAYTLGVLDSLEKQALAEIARLGGNQGLEGIINALHIDATSNI